MIALHLGPNIIGVTRNAIEREVSLYTDNQLLYVSNLSVSPLAALRTFSLFGHISAYTLNLDKSELFLLNVAAHVYLLHNFPSKIACMVLHMLVSTLWSSLEIY